MHAPQRTSTTANPNTQRAPTADGTSSSSSWNTQSSTDGSGAYAHAMPARGVFLVRRREVDLVRVASAACCLGAGPSPLISA